MRKRATVEWTSALSEAHSRIPLLNHRRKMRQKKKDKKQTKNKNYQRAEEDIRESEVKRRSKMRAHVRVFSTRLRNRAVGFLVTRHERGTKVRYYRYCSTVFRFPWLPICA